MDRTKTIANAQKHIQRGNYKKAIREYQKILKAEPDDVRTLLKVGDLEARAGMVDRAISTYHEVADHYSAKGFFLKAVAVYKQILRLDTDAVEVNLRLAQLYHQLSLLSDAMAQYEQVASHYQAQGRWTEYREIVERMVELDPENVWNRIKLAEQFIKDGIADAAVEHLGAAADVLLETGRFDDFVKVVERLLYYDEENAERIKQLVRVYLDRNEPKKALPKVQLLFRVAPDDTSALDLFVETFRALGETDRAIAALEDLAQRYGSEGRDAMQEAAYRKILGIDPRHAAALDALGEVAAEGAERETKVVGGGGDDAPGEPRPRTPTDEADLERLLAESDVYIKYGLLDRAHEHLAPLYEAYPFHPGVLERRKEVALRENDLETAVDALCRMAESLNAADPSAAQRRIDEALSLRPDDPKVLELRERLLASIPTAKSGDVAALDDEEHAAEEAEEDVDLLSDSVIVDIYESGTFEQPGEASVDIDLADSVLDVDIESIAEEETSGDFDDLDALFREFEDESSYSDAHRSLEDSLFLEDEDSAAYVDHRMELVDDAGRVTGELNAVSPDEYGDLPSALRDAFREVDFFLAQGLTEEARATLLELLGEYPQFAEQTMSRLDQLDSEAASLQESGLIRIPDYDADADSDFGDDQPVSGVQRPTTDVAIDEDWDGEIDDADFEVVDEEPALEDFDVDPDHLIVAASDDELEALIELDDDTEAEELVDEQDVASELFADFESLGHETTEDASPPEIDAPLGRPSSFVSSVTFGNTARILAQEAESELARAVRERMEGNAMGAMGALGELTEGRHPREATFEFALAHLEMGMYFEASAMLEELLAGADLPPRDAALVAYFAGVAFEALDQNERAKECFRQVTSLAPGQFPDVPLRLQRID